MCQVKWKLHSFNVNNQETGKCWRGLKGTSNAEWCQTVQINWCHYRCRCYSNWLILRGGLTRTVGALASLKKFWYSTNKFSLNVFSTNGYAWKRINIRQAEISENSGTFLGRQWTFAARQIISTVLSVLHMPVLVAKTRTFIIRVFKTLLMQVVPKKRKYLWHSNGKCFAYFWVRLKASL